MSSRSFKKSTCPKCGHEVGVYSDHSIPYMRRVGGVIYRFGEGVCTKCGLYFKEVVESEPEG